MKNTLSVKQFMEQKTNKQACKAIALSLCAATKRAWEKAEFEPAFEEELVVRRDYSQTEDNKLSTEGYSFKFALHETDVDPDAEKSEDYGTAEHIIANADKPINVDEIHTFIAMHNQDWNVVASYYFKNLSKYLDLKYLVVLNGYESVPVLDEYVSPDDIYRSSILPPAAYSSENGVPKVAVELKVITRNTLKAYGTAKKAELKEKEEAEN